MLVKLEQDEKSVCTGFEILNKLVEESLSQKRYNSAAPANWNIRTASKHY